MWEALYEIIPKIRRKENIGKGYNKEIVHIFRRNQNLFAVFLS